MQSIHKMRICFLSDSLPCIPPPCPTLVLPGVLLCRAQHMLIVHAAIMPAVPHTHTQTRTYTPGQLYVESGQLRGLRFKNISKCDASVLYLRKCLAQTQRYKYVYLYISMWVCVCVKCAVFCIAWRNTYLAANSFCQFHVRNYKLRGEYPIWFILFPFPSPLSHVV